MYNPSIDEAGSANFAWLRRVVALVRDKATMANIIGLGVAILALICLFAIPNSQYWNIRLPLYLIAAIWTILRPRIALYLLPFAIPWGSLDPLQLGGSLTSADILVGLLAASWLLSFALRPLVARSYESVGPLDREKYNVPRYLAITIVLLLLTMLLSTTVAFSVATSLKEIVKWLELLVTVMLGAQYIRTRQQIWLLAVILCLAAISQAFYGYAQAFLNLGPASFIRDASLRVYSTFGQPNPYAGYINMTLVLALALLLLGRGAAIRILAGITTAILAGVEFLTQSKGGWLALLVSVIFIIVVGMPHLRKLMAIFGVAALGILAAFLTGKVPPRFYLPILMKIGVVNISFTAPTSDNYANSERVAHWFAGIRMFLDHPFLGVGIGNYSQAYPPYAPGIFVIPLGHAHNYFINIAAESGLFGLVAFILFISATFIVGNKTVRALSQRYQQLNERLARPLPVKTPSALLSAEGRRTAFSRLSILVNDRALAIGLTASLLSVSIHNLVDNLYVHGMTILFALLLVLLLRLEGVARDS